MSAAGSASAAAVRRAWLCPVVGCTGIADATFVLAFLPADRTARRYVHGCAVCWRRAGMGESVRVEFEPDDRSRVRPRVTIGGAQPSTRD